jgi:hypothetical protein
MPANGSILSSRWRWVFLTIALVTVAPFAFIKIHHRVARGWGQYRAPAPSGNLEARVRQLLLSEQPVEIRFAGLFHYFAAGFVRHAVPGYARVQYGGAGSRNGYELDGLEGFARTAPLLAAWTYSGRSQLIENSSTAKPVTVVEILRSGILDGTNPHARQYWGDIEPQDQRIVEAADVARVLWLTRKEIWNHLSTQDRQRVRTWLMTAGNTQTPRTNWMLFPVVINLTLASLEGESERPLLLERARSVFSQYRQLYLDRGWFNDPPHGVDFYNTWGITYDLFWIHTVDPTFESQFITSALEQSAELTQYLIGPKGIPILGRSVCYRTAVAVPLIAATHLESARFPPGKAIRALDTVWRYFIDHDSLRDGALTQGYFGADLRLLDLYSGSGSCHWGLRSLVLAFMHPAGDAFWSAPQEALPVEMSDYRLELDRLGWVVEGKQASGDINITVVANTREVDEIEDYSLRMRIQEFLTRQPARPGNWAVKYDSRHYSSTTPFPLKH